MFLFVTWGAIRFGRHGALLIIVMTAIQMLLGMVLEVGGSTTNQVPVGLLNFWLYILVVTGVGILLALVIDERRSTEVTLRQSRDLFNKLTQRVPGVIYQFKLFPDGRSCFPFASEAIQDIYEVTPEQVREDAAAVFAILHPEDYDGIVASIQESAHTLNLWRYEFRVVLPKQGLRWRLGESQPERLEDGSVLWHGIITDITERKLADQERNRFTDILERSLNEIYLFDAETLLFKYTNEGARRNLGYTADLLHTMTPVDIKPNFDEASFRDLIGPLLRREKELLIFEAIHRRADRTDYPVLVHLQLVGLEDHLQFLAVIQDITEHKRIESELSITQTAIEKSQSAFFRVNAAGLVLYANDFACQSLGILGRKYLA